MSKTQVPVALNWLFIAIISSMLLLLLLNAILLYQVQSSFFFSSVFLLSVFTLSGMFIILKKKMTGILLIPISMSMVMMVAELGLRCFLISSSERGLAMFKPPFWDNPIQLPLFNAPVAKFDSVTGYKWLQQETNVIKISGNKIEYINSFKGNNKGYHADKDYFFQKPSDTYRIMVLGDSFTDAYFLASPWTERWEKQLNQENDQFEVYNFGINGGGIVNWHRIFFREIVPHYTFDAVVLAVFGNDLQRDFFFMHHEANQALLGYADASQLDQFDSILQHAERYNSIITDTQWSRIKEIYERPINWKTADFLSLEWVYNKVALLMKSAQEPAGLKRVVEEYILPDKQSVHLASIEQKYEDKLILLSEIIQYSKVNDKDVFILCIPEMAGARISLSGMKPQIAAELEMLAKKHEVHFWSGYSAYSKADTSLPNRHFMVPDGHWNQKGADFFADAIPDTLLSKP